MISDVDNERHYACLGAMGIKEISIHFQFSWKTKTALKNEQLITIYTKRNKNRKLCGGKKSRNMLKPCE